MEARNAKNQKEIEKRYSDLDPEKSTELNEDRKLTILIHSLHRICVCNEVRLERAFFPGK